MAFAAGHKKAEHELQLQNVCVPLEKMRPLRQGEEKMPSRFKRCSLIIHNDP